MEDLQHFKPEILLDTQYAHEEFNLTWKVANFSQIFDIVHAEFSLQRSSTKWTLKLVDKRFIVLKRCDTGEPVNVDLDYCLVTSFKRFRYKKFHKFDSNHKDLDLLNLNACKIPDANTQTPYITKLKFEEDVFKFHCKMNIVGPAKTKIVRSNDYLKPNLEKLCDDFKNLLHNTELCDIIISSGKEKLPVHKVVLCARSKVFNTMFQNDMFENKKQLIELNDIDFDTIKDFITFLYTGEVTTFSFDKAMNLYYVADRYDVQDLREKCSLFLEFNLSVDVACTVLKLAELHRDDKLKCAARFFIQMYEPTVKLTDAWKDLVKENPKLAFEILK